MPRKPIKSNSVIFHFAFYASLFYVIVGAVVTNTQ